MKGKAEDEGEKYTDIELPALFGALKRTEEELENLLKEDDVDGHKLFHLLKGAVGFLKLENRRKAIVARKLGEKISEQYKVINVISHGIAEYLASEQKSPALKEKYARVYFCLLRQGIPFSEFKDHLGNYGRLRKVRLDHLNQKRAERGRPDLKL